MKNRATKIPPNRNTLPSLSPDIRLFGAVDQSMLSEFFRQQSQVNDVGPLVLELSTSGGDADIGRRIGQEIRLWQEKQMREVFFFGKTYVYSAGVTIMSFFPVTHRFVTGDCEFLIHERKLKKDLHLEGALRGCRSAVQDVLAQIDSGQRLERDGFAQLVLGTKLTVDDVQKQVLDRDWYLTASDALKLGLISGVV